MFITMQSKHWDNTSKKHVWLVVHKFNLSISENIWISFVYLGFTRVTTPLISYCNQDTFWSYYFIRYTSESNELKISNASLKFQLREVPKITIYIILESSSPAHLLTAYLQDFKRPLSCWKLHSTNSLVRDFPVLEVISIKEYVISFQSWR